MTRAFWILAMLSASCGAEATSPASAVDAMLADSAARPDSPVPPIGVDAAVIGADATRADAGAVCTGVDLATDPQNCGMCGNACAVATPSTVSCVASRCVEVLARVAQPVALAQDATQLYWTDPVSGVVDTIAKTGGAITTLASGRAKPNSISIDAGEVYWAELADPTETTQIGGVFAMPITGAPPTTVVSSVDYPYQMLATNGTVFYTAATGGTQPLEVERAGTSSTLWAPGIAAMTSTKDTVYWVTAATFDLDARNYFDADATLMSAPVAGGPATIIATGLTNTGGIAVDATYAYVTQPGTVVADDAIIGLGSIVRIKLVDGTSVVLAADYMQAFAIAVDAANVYWVSFRDGTEGELTGSGSIRSVAIGGGTMTTLASAQVAPSGLVVDDIGVYWTILDTYTGVDGSGAVLGIVPKP